MNFNFKIVRTPEVSRSINKMFTETGIMREFVASKIGKKPVNFYKIVNKGKFIDPRFIKQVCEVLGYEVNFTLENGVVSVEFIKLEK